MIARYLHRELEGARTWIEPSHSPNSNRYDFSSVYLLGGSHLATMPDGNLTTHVETHIGRVYGDKSGKNNTVINTTSVLTTWWLPSSYHA